MAPNTNTKPALRKLLLDRRRAIKPIDRQRAAENAARLLVASDIFQKSTHIACYLASPSEFDCMPIIKAVWQAQKKCYLPVLSTKAEKTLVFAEYLPETELQLNRHQILEPKGGKIIPTQQLEIVLLPMLGFDNEGNRLGMGGGYYDRTFEFLTVKSDRCCYLVGLGYEAQRVAKLQKDQWDISLDGIFSELVFTKC